MQELIVLSISRTAGRMKGNGEGILLLTERAWKLKRLESDCLSVRTFQKLEVAGGTYLGRNDGSAYGRVKSRRACIQTSDDERAQGSSE